MKRPYGLCRVYLFPLLLVLLLGFLSGCAPQMVAEASQQSETPQVASFSPQEEPPPVPEEEPQPPPVEPAPPPPVVVVPPIPHVEKGLYIYSVKFLLGEAKSESEGVKPANYATAVNIHNFLDESVTVKKKAVIAVPQGQPGIVSAYEEFKMGPNWAVEVDGADISNLLGLPFPPQSFVKGFVVIESPKPLNVVAVYTSSTSGVFSRGFSMDIEYISPALLPSAPPEPDKLLDTIIDADGVVTSDDGIPGAVEVSDGDLLIDFTGTTNYFLSLIGMFDTDSSGSWTEGDDLIAHTSANVPKVILDKDGSLTSISVPDFYLDALTTYWGIRYHDANGNGGWDNGEDIVLDTNGDYIFNGN